MNCGAWDGVPSWLESVPEVKWHLCRARARPATHSRDRHGPSEPRHAELGSRNSIALASDFSYHVMAAAPAEVMAEERASRRFRNCADH